jgi:hypothetical protein
MMCGNTHTISNRECGGRSSLVSKTSCTSFLTPDRWAGQWKRLALQAQVFAVEPTIIELALRAGSHLRLFLRQMIAPQLSQTSDSLIIDRPRSSAA